MKKWNIHRKKKKKRGKIVKEKNQSLFCRERTKLFVGSGISFEGGKEEDSFGFLTQLELIQRK